MTALFYSPETKKGSVKFELDAFILYSLFFWTIPTLLLAHIIYQGSEVISSLSQQLSTSQPGDETTSSSHTLAMALFGQEVNEAALDQNNFRSSDFYNQPRISSRQFQYNFGSKLSLDPLQGKSTRYFSRFMRFSLWSTRPLEDKLAISFPSSHFPIKNRLNSCLNIAAVVLVATSKIFEPRLVEVVYFLNLQLRLSYVLEFLDPTTYPLIWVTMGTSFFIVLDLRNVVILWTILGLCFQIFLWFLWTYECWDILKLMIFSYKRRSVQHGIRKQSRRYLFRDFARHLQYVRSGIFLLDVEMRIIEWKHVRTLLNLLIW
jgi:hypothetical protein